MTVFWMSLGMGALAGASGRPIPNVSPSRRNHFTPCCLLRSRGSDAHPPGKRRHSPGSARSSARHGQGTSYHRQPAPRGADDACAVASAPPAGNRGPIGHERCADVMNNFGTKAPSRQARSRSFRAPIRLVAPTIGGRPLTISRRLRSPTLPQARERPRVSDFFTPEFPQDPPLFGPRDFFTLKQPLAKFPSNWHTYCSCFAAHPGAGKLWVIF